MARNENETEDDTVKKIMKYAVAGIIIIILLTVIFGSFYTIKSGQEGVLLTFGRAENQAIQPGIHIKLPLVQEIVKFDIKTQKYETGAAAASKDLQDVSTNVAVNYKITEGTTPKLFSEIGPTYESKVIQPGVQEVVKAVTAKFTAEELITRRSEVSQDIETTLRERLAPRNLNVESIAITNFAFSQSFTQAIEAKVTAEQASLEQKNLLEKVKYEAEQIRAQAAGERDAAIARATGEAEKVKLVQQQLMQSPQYIEYIKAQKWNGALPNFLMTGTGGQTPILMQIPIIGNQNATEQ